MRKFTVKTNKKGRYFHGVIPLGYYRVSVHVNGTEMHAVPRVRIYRTKRPGDTFAYDAEPVKVDFDLQAIAKLKKKRQEALAKRSASEVAADRAKEEERKFGHMNDEFQEGAGNISMPGATGRPCRPMPGRPRWTRGNTSFLPRWERRTGPCGNTTPPLKATGRP